MGALTSHKSINYLFIYLYLIGFSVADTVIWECTVQEECADLEGGECKQGYCVCPVGMMINNDNTGCIPANTSPYLFSPCEESKQCNRLVTGYECHQETKKCVCREGYHYLSGRCWMSVGHSEDCISPFQCHDPLQPLSMECKQGTCVCKDSYYQREPGQCRKKATALGDQCILNDDCQIEGTPQAVCDLISLTCVDPDIDDIPKNPALRKSQYIKRSSRYLPYTINTNSTAGKSIKNSVKSVGEECFIDADCAKFGPAFCSNGRICFCNRGYYPSEDGEKCIAELGTRNPMEGTCAGFAAVVEDGVCTCPAGFFFFNLPYRDCRKPARQLGESCLDDISCRTFGLFSYCKTTESTELRHCVCDEDKSKINLERQFCQPFDAIIGENCESDDNCPSTAKCVDDVCSCEGDTIPSPTMAECLAVGLGLGDDCVSSEQCTGTPNIKCTNRKCTCDEGYLEDEEVGGFCVTGIGGECASNEDCTISNSECTEHSVTRESTQQQCRCVNGFIDESNKCYKLAEDINEECQVNAQCSQLGNENTVACTNGKCSCLPRMHFRDGRCFERKSLNEVCSSSSQCFIFGNVYNSECRNSLCQCIPGYRATFNPDYCNSAVTIKNLSWISLLIIAMLSYIVH